MNFVFHTLTIVKLFCHTLWLGLRTWAISRRVLFFFFFYLYLRMFTDSREWGRERRATGCLWYISYLGSNHNLGMSLDSELNPQPLWCTLQSMLSPTEPPARASGRMLIHSCKHVTDIVGWQWDFLWWLPAPTTLSMDMLVASNSLANSWTAWVGSSYVCGST